MPTLCPSFRPPSAGDPHLLTLALFSTLSSRGQPAAAQLHDATLACRMAAVCVIDGTLTSDVVQLQTALLSSSGTALQLQHAFAQLYSLATSLLESWEESSGPPPPSVMTLISRSFSSRHPCVVSRFLGYNFAAECLLRMRHALPPLWPLPQDAPPRLVAAALALLAHHGRLALVQAPIVCPWFVNCVLGVLPFTLFSERSAAALVADVRGCLVVLVLC